MNALEPEPLIDVSHLTREQTRHLGAAQQFIHDLRPTIRFNPYEEQSWNQAATILQEAAKTGGVTPVQLEQLKKIAEEYAHRKRISDAFELHRNELIQLHEEILNAIENHPEIKSAIQKTKSRAHRLEHLSSAIRALKNRCTMHGHHVQTLVIANLESFPRTFECLLDSKTDLIRRFICRSCCSLVEVFPKIAQWKTLRKRVYELKQLHGQIASEVPTKEERKKSLKEVIRRQVEKKKKEKRLKDAFGELEKGLGEESQDDHP